MIGSLYAEGNEDHLGGRDTLKTHTHLQYKENDSQCKTNPATVETVRCVNIKCSKMTQQSETWHATQCYAMDAARYIQVHYEQSGKKTIYVN